MNTVIGNDMPANWIESPKCFTCKKDFTCKTDFNKQVYRHPFILPCGHILCSCCVSLLRKSPNRVRCDQCPSKLQSIEPSSLHRLECDYYLLGFIQFQKNILPGMMRRISTDDKSTSTTKKTQENQCVECLLSTKLTCVQCNGNPYCESCFHKVHSAGVVFRTHDLLPKDNPSSSVGRVLGNCKSHVKKKLDLYCQTCSIPICSNCCSTAHVKHETINLLKNNRNVDLNEPVNLLGSVQRMIDESKKSTVDCISKTDEFALETAQDIFSCFQYYHSLLQNLEKEAYNELKRRTHDTLKQLHSVQDTLDTSAEHVEAFITRMTELKKTPPSDVNLAALQNEIMCQLEKIKTDFDFEQFNMNPFIFNGSGFKKHCDLKDLCRVVFEPYIFTPKMKTFFTSKRQTKDDSQSDKHDVSIDVSISSGLMSYHNIELERESNVTVYTRKVIVTEIIDPKTLCVQDVSFLARADEIEMECNQCAMEEGVLRSDIIIDEMYLIFENNIDKWYRGIVKKQEKHSYSVFLVDHGRHIKIKKKQIRKVSENLKLVPKAAILFTINVEPINGIWKDECVDAINEVALGSHATIIYSGEDSGDCIIHQDYPTSLQEMMLYLNYAKIPQTSGNAINQIHRDISREKKSLMEKLTNKKSFEKLQLSNDLSVKVENIVSPEELYITVADRTEELAALHLKLQNIYNRGYTRKVYCPHLKMPCCVRISDYWHRARVEAIRPGIIEVYLIDNGTTFNTEWNYLRALDDEFLTLPEGVTVCGLVDIAPKDFKPDWGTAATLELKRLCKNELKAYVCGTRKQIIQIELFAIKKTATYKINAYLAERNLVEWVGEGDMVALRPNERNDSTVTSMSSAIISKKAHTKEFRQTVKILDIVTPSELYVTLAKYESGIEKMHAELQNTVALSNLEIRDWEEGEACLVFSKMSRSAKKCWYRGRIASNLGGNNFTVYLRDYGQEVPALLNDLTDIPLTYDTVSDAAYKCHLANIKPTSSEWGKAAIAEFKHMTLIGEEFDSFSLSVYGEKKNGSIPIYLWGRKKPSRDDALFGSKMIWANINEVFALKGYADCIEKFKTIVHCNQIDIDLLENKAVDFTKWYKRFIANVDDDAKTKQKDTLYDEGDFILEPELDPEHENFSTSKVESWPPAKQINKYNFHATPTYVDNNAIIYLHEQSQEEYLKHIRYTINKHIHEVTFDESYKWKKYEPCMAQFEDKFFYRGIIIDVLPDNQYNVKYVDYGNVEKCEANQLRPANMLGNIPIQATKYFLAYLKPVGSDTIWNAKILEFIHAHVVNKLVYVRVEEHVDAIHVPCTITAGLMDVNKVLVVEKLAERTDDINVQIKLPDTYDYYKETPKNEKRDVDLYKQSSLPLEEFQQIIAQRNAAQKEHESFDKFDVHCTIDYVIEDSDAEFFKQNDRRHSFELDIDVADFEPFDTSSVISMKTYNLLPFTPIKLSKNTTKFPCKIYEALDTLHLFVEPIIEKYIDDFEAMENEIKKPSKKFAPLGDSRDKRVCLARYDVDNCYYRAIIKDQISTTQVRVRFVDYLNEQIVERKYIRECPDELVKKPLKHLLVKIHGVKPAKRVRDFDILKELRKLVGRETYAIIVKHDNIPSVHLYNSANNLNELVYQSLINNHFYFNS